MDHLALKTYPNIIRNDSTLNVENVRKFLQEYEIRSQMNHANIVKQFGVSFGDAMHPPSIPLEFCPSNLKEKIQKLTNEERITAIIDISLAMKEVHAAGFIHGNLRLENILLDERNKIKVSGFGYCILISCKDEPMTISPVAGNIEYMTPELLQEKTNFNEKIDVYAFGVVVFLILTKGIFPVISPNEVIRGENADIPASVSQFSTKLITRCWSYRADDRPSFAEIYETLDKNEIKLI